ncbi:MAG: pseudouridine-5'-phosphate glycosidase [Myxococcota bacterium]
MNTNEFPVALETTLLAHGVPAASALPLYDRLTDICVSEGATGRLIGIVGGRSTTEMTRDELGILLRDGATKVNTANLGLAMFRKQSAATTVSTTMELASQAGIRVFATGGLGGIHPGYGSKLDISADLAAFTRFPVAVVTSGVKSILEVESTREAFETLGVTVVGFGTDRFPAFYLRESAATVDARFDDVDELADFLDFELSRTGRGIVVGHPIPAEHAVDPVRWSEWLATAREMTRHTDGRDVTPALLSTLAEISGGRTLAANLALIEANTRLASQLAVRMASR